MATYSARRERQFRRLPTRFDREQTGNVLLCAQKGRGNSELLPIPSAGEPGCAPSMKTSGRTLSEISERGTLSQSAPASVSPVRSLSRVGQRLFSFPAVLACSLAYLVFLFSRRNIADPDLWWHLRNAQYLLTTGHLPVVDSYSYTAPGAAVLPFEWLAEIPYYLAYKWAGLSGVFVLVFLICTAIVLGIFRLSYLASHDVKNAFLATVGGAVLAAISIGARTLLFGWLYLVASALDSGSGEARRLEMALAGAPSVLPMGEFARLVAHGDGGVWHFYRLWVGGRVLGARLRDALVRAATAEATHHGWRLRRSAVYQSLRISSRLLSVQGHVREPGPGSATFRSLRQLTSTRPGER